MLSVLVHQNYFKLLVTVMRRHGMFSGSSGSIFFLIFELISSEFLRLYYNNHLKYLLILVKPTEDFAVSVHMLSIRIITIRVDHSWIILISRSLINVDSCASRYTCRSLQYFTWNRRLELVECKNDIVAFSLFLLYLI